MPFGCFILICIALPAETVQGKTMRWWMSACIHYLRSDKSMFSMSSGFVINLPLFKWSSCCWEELHCCWIGLVFHMFSPPNSRNISSKECFKRPIKKEPKNAEVVFITYRQGNFSYISVGVHLQSARTRGTFCWFSQKPHRSSHENIGNEWK